jgi:uncharacterized protein YdaU (DUF1376 family)
MHYYRFSIGDYARSTRHLSNDEDLAFRRLLDMYYENEAPIPLETQWVARRIRMDSEIVEVVLNDMFERSDDGYHHARCDAEIAEYHKQAERNRANGKRGGRPKTAKKHGVENPVGSHSEPTGNPVVTLTTNQEPLTTNQEPDIEPNGSCASGDAPLTVNEVLENWNEVAGDLGLAKVRKLTDARKRKLQSQIRRFPLDDWLVVFRKIGQSSFLKGDNRNGWRCDFDFILSEGNFVKILEGKYDRQAAGSTN